MPFDTPSQSPPVHPSCYCFPPDPHISPRRVHPCWEQTWAKLAVHNFSIVFVGHEWQSLCGMKVLATAHNLPSARNARVLKLGSVKCIFIFELPLETAFLFIRNRGISHLSVGSSRDFSAEVMGISCFACCRYLRTLFTQNIIDHYSTVIRTSTRSCYFSLLMKKHSGSKAV